MLFIFILVIIASYFLGALPFMILLARARGIDISREPDLHHAMWYKVGRGWGMLGIFFDIFKGIIPVLACFLPGFPLAVSVWSGLAAVIGQMWPVFRNFNGERGNTTGVGALGAISTCYGAPLILIIALIPAGIGFLIRTFNRWEKSGDSLNERLKFGGPPSLALPLGVILGFGSAPVTSIIFNQSLEMTLGFAGILLLILVRRLTADIRQDVKNSNGHWGHILLNRLLFDRSEI